jgi:hypothetical protein
MPQEQGAVGMTDHLAAPHQHDSFVSDPVERSVSFVSELLERSVDEQIALVHILATVEDP